MLGHGIKRYKYLKHAYSYSGIMNKDKSIKNEQKYHMFSTMANDQNIRFSERLNGIEKNLNAIGKDYQSFADAIKIDIDALKDMQKDAEKNGKEAANKELSGILSLFESGKLDEAREKINNTIKTLANEVSSQPNSKTNQVLQDTEDSIQKGVDRLKKTEEAGMNRLKDTEEAYNEVKNAMEAGYNKYIHNLDKELSSKTKLDYKSSRKTGLRMMGNNILNSLRSGKVGGDMKNAMDSIKKDMENALKGHIYADTKSIQAEIDEMFKDVSPQQMGKNGGVKNLIKSGAMGAAGAGVSTYGANSVQQKIDLYDALKTKMGNTLDSKKEKKTNEVKKAGSEAIEKAKENIKRAFESNFSKINGADEEKDQDKLGTVAYWKKASDLLGVLGSARKMMEKTGNTKSAAKYIKDHIEGKNEVMYAKKLGVTVIDKREAMTQAAIIKSFLENPSAWNALGFKSDAGTWVWVKRMLPYNNNNKAYKDFKNNGVLSDDDSIGLMASIYERLVRNNKDTFGKYISEMDLANMEIPLKDRKEGIYDPKKVKAIGIKIMLAGYLETSEAEAKKNHMQIDARAKSFAETGFASKDVSAYISDNIDEYNAALKKLRDTGSYLAPLLIVQATV